MAKKKIELYSSIKRDPKILMNSNSNNNYHRNNSNGKKKYKYSWN